MHLCLCVVGFVGPRTWGPKCASMEASEGPPVSSPDPAITSSVEQPALSSTHAVAGMPDGSPTVPTHTPHHAGQASINDNSSDTADRDFSSHMGTNEEELDAARQAAVQQLAASLLVGEAPSRVDPPPIDVEEMLAAACR